MEIKITLYPEAKHSTLTVTRVSRKGTFICTNEAGETLYITEKVFNSLCEYPDSPCVVRERGPFKFLGTFLTF